MDMLMVGKSISDARKKAGLTQATLSDKIGVSVQAVSKWENGHNLPDVENLMQISELTNTPYSVLLGGNHHMEDLENIYIRYRLFNEDNMFTRLKTFALAEKLNETYHALEYMREQHAGQLRKPGKYTTEKVLYINHPLLMACQAHAYGVRDDALLASILLHDVVEDTSVSSKQLPFSNEVKTIVELVSFSVPQGKTYREAKIDYYNNIKTNCKACVVKILDRCNNVSTMAGSFSREKLIEYISETEEFIIPLADLLKNCYPKYCDLAFLVKYQIISVLETVKNLIMD